jgi:hypothetical protein
MSREEAMKGLKLNWKKLVVEKKLGKVLALYMHTHWSAGVGTKPKINEIFDGNVMPEGGDTK